MQTLEVPSAPIAPPAISAPASKVPASVGSATPPSTGVINVVPQLITPTEPPKPGSAKDEMFKRLGKHAEKEDAAPAVPAKDAKPPETTPAKDKVEAAKPGEAPPATEPATPLTPEEKKKVSPWKLVEEFKQKALKAEARALELEKIGLPEDKRKLLAERFQAQEKRLQELEEEIKFVNYSKSKEFAEKHQVPYEKAWERAMGDLRELTVTDEAGNTRGVQPSDLLELVNMSLPLARERAEMLFGEKFANDVMAHRKEIRGLFEQQSAAIEEAKKNGSTRDQTRTQQYQEFQKRVQQEVGQHWTRFNESAKTDDRYGKFFTPEEGDDEGNAKLEKGFQLVDQAFSENPFDPKLKPEEREGIIKRHAAVRNRAAAFGRLVATNIKLESKLAEMTKELEQFKSSTPPADGGRITPGTPVAGNPRSRMLANLNKLAVKT